MPNPFYNVGPGHIIQDALDALGWACDDLANATGLAPATIGAIMEHREAITCEIAQCLATVFQTTLEVWLNLDNAYRVRENEAGVR